MHHPTLLYSTLILLLCSCSISSDRDSSHTFRTFTENGVTIAETTGGPKYEGEIFEYEPVLTLKGNPDDEESLLFRAGTFTVDQDGYFHILDNGDHRIAVFNQEGSYVRSYGGEGDGPGEFRNMRLQYLHEGVIHIYDSRRRRTSRFTIDGEFLDVVSTPPTASSGIVELFYFPEGLVLVSPTTEEKDNLVFSGLETLFISTDGDTTARIEIPPFLTNYRFELRSGGGGGSRIKYTGQPLVQYSPDNGLFITTGVTPEIQIYSLAGDLKELIRLNLEPEPVTTEERNAIIQNLDAIVQSYRDNNSFFLETTEANRRALYITELKAFWEDMQVAVGGYIWLQVPEVYDAESTNRGRKYRVLSPAGEYLGDTRWPEWMPGRIVGDLLLTMQLDEETGERIPTVFKIIPVAEGLKFP